MKRLLAYLFIVIGLGLTVNVNVKAEEAIHELLTPANKGKIKEWNRYINMQHKYYFWSEVRNFNKRKYDYEWKASNNYEQALNVSMKGCEQRRIKNSSKYNNSEICVVLFFNGIETTDKQKIQFAEDFYGKKIAYNSFELNKHILKNPETLITKKKTKQLPKKNVVKKIDSNQPKFDPEIVEDIKPPIIKIAKKITVKNPSYEITGTVQDDTSEVIYLEVDGEIIKNTTNGEFQIQRFSPVNEKISLVAIDKWGNRTKPFFVDIIVKKNETIVKKLERLNPSLIKTSTKNQKIALIIGIENYNKAPVAKFANLDAQYFYEYVTNVFGVKKQNIKMLIDKEANLIASLTALSKWLPGKIKKNQTELIIFFAGHGLASSNGKDFYLLSQDSDPDLLARTALSRTELFQEIINLNPKSVTMFLDTCYSGVSRDEQMLLASARPVRIVADDQEGIPDNFTIFSASQLDQISSGFETFNKLYFLIFI